MELPGISLIHDRDFDQEIPLTLMESGGKAAEPGRLPEWRGNILPYGS